MSGVTNKPNLEAYVGSTGSGKGVSIKARLKALQAEGWPLIIWDPRDEYADFATRANAAQVVEAVAAIKRGGRARPPAVRFVHDGKTPIAKAFAWICEAAFTAGGCVFLAEELSDVTTASLAPPQWKRILTQGRHVGLYVIGAAQRPALIDKTFLGQCTFVRVFNLRYAEDRKAMAKAMDVSEDEVAKLRTTDDDHEGKPWISTTINYLERDFRRQVLQAGQIKLKKKREAT